MTNEELNTALYQKMLPSFSIRYKYRSEIPMRVVSSSTVRSDFSHAILMISPSASGCFCTISTIKEPMRYPDSKYLTQKDKLMPTKPGEGA